ncbi:BTB/POZ and MATH domain-containing protein 1-like [Panicum miliaceum]|uniref:BTB/POZ and MATH domain-containing protein 1-like n=1 Tax=Panicum miliaceum TaxID=4540 RepID=A0A3L6RI34_PANMI|nr:BTB/POZ and MATH domain-containing protein 1-like [Panicum miliaceum]
MLDSGFTEFKLDLAATKNLAAGDALHLSDEFSAGGHIWRVRCYPHADGGLNLSFYLLLVGGGSRKVRVIFEAFLMDRDGAPSSSHVRRCLQMYPPPGGYGLWGLPNFLKRADLESGDYLKDGRVTIMFGVIVLRDDSPTAVASPIAVPPSDIGDHLGRLLDGADSSDVSFAVGGETFCAHRAVLAARSSVFKAQLLGAMADAMMPTITLHDIQPETFRNLLRFIYTDALPAEREVVAASSTTTAFFQDLLAVADMYALDRLKLACAQRLWEGVSGGHRGGGVRLR